MKFGDLAGSTLGRKFSEGMIRPGWIFRNQYCNHIYIQILEGEMFAHGEKAVGKGPEFLPI